MNALTLSADSVVAHAESAIVAEIDGQIVALDIAQGVCYGLNRVATRVWELIKTPETANGCADVLTAEFDVDRETCLSEVVFLFNDLRDAGLIQVVDAPTAR